MTRDRIRVMVVEDSQTVRRRLCEVIASDPGFEFVGEAGDGRSAIEGCRDLRPDVVSLDMMLPVMTGQAVTEYVMAYFPTPILVVSASTNRGELFRTYDALAAGALDVLEKPTGLEKEGEWEARYLASLRQVSRIRVITHIRARLAPHPPIPAGTTAVTPVPGAGGFRALAIGASTGGPGAVIEVLRSLPTGFSLPILLVLHMAEPFAQPFADWLDGQSSHRVSYAREGDRLSEMAGRVLLAPPNRHLEVQGGLLRLSDGPERHSCRPSVDVLFESLARSPDHPVIACLLTGMGKDGAKGLLEIRRSGGLTVAQDEATSVVWGMPREAVVLGAAERVLPLEGIGPAVVEAAVLGPSRRTP